MAHDYCILSFGPVKRSWNLCSLKPGFFIEFESLGFTLTQLMKESYVACEGVGLVRQHRPIKVGFLFYRQCCEGFFPRRWFNRMAEVV